MLPGAFKPSPATRTPGCICWVLMAYVEFVELDTEGKESLDWQKLSFQVKANQWYASLVAMGLSYSSSNVG